MGNTITAAQMAASQIAGPFDSKAVLSPSQPPVGDKLHVQPPPECPMHNKQQVMVIKVPFFVR